MNVIDRVANGDPAAIAFLGMLWFLFFTIKYHLELKKISSWPSVIGKLTDFRFRDGDGSVDSMISVRYDFELDGESYNGRRLAHISFGPGVSLSSVKQNMMNSVERLADGKVVIYYNPKKPKKNLLLKPGKPEYILLSVCYGFGVLLAYAVFR